MMHNEKGVTLIELLAALVIFGIFSTIVWAFFFQSFQANDTEITKNSLQQEANLIVNTLHEVHKTSVSYQVITSENGDYLRIESDTRGIFLFDKSTIIYELGESDTFKVGDSITPKTKDFQMNLTLKSKANEHLQTNVQTIFSKIK